MSGDSNEGQELVSWPRIYRWAVWIVAGGALVLASVTAIYAAKFWRSAVSSDPAAWGQFGDFLGGTSNPILSFLTIAMLAVTIALQSRQLSISSKELQLSRKELALTRSELKRSASAQELSEKALRSQANAAETNTQLATINALMSYYASEIASFDRQSYPFGDPRQLELQGLKRRHAVLQQRLEHMYSELIGEENEP